MPKISKKKPYWLAKKAEQGRLQAQREFAKKQGLLEIAKNKLMETSLENLTEIAALATLTVLVKGTIEGALELKNRIVPKAGTYWSPLPVETREQIYTALGFREKLSEEQWVIWGWSFVIAYILIRHAGQIIGLLGEGLSGLGGFIGKLIP